MRECLQIIPVLLRQKAGFNLDINPAAALPLWLQHIYFRTKLCLRMFLVTCSDLCPLAGPLMHWGCTGDALKIPWNTLIYSTASGQNAHWDVCCVHPFPSLHFLASVLTSASPYLNLLPRSHRHLEEKNLAIPQKAKHTVGSSTPGYAHKRTKRMFVHQCSFQCYKSQKIETIHISTDWQVSQTFPSH